MWSRSNFHFIVAAWWLILFSRLYTHLCIVLDIATDLSKVSWLKDAFQKDSSMLTTLFEDSFLLIICYFSTFYHRWFRWFNDSAFFWREFKSRVLVIIIVFSSTWLTKFHYHTYSFFWEATSHYNDSNKRTSWRCARNTIAEQNILDEICVKEFGVQISIGYMITWE